jgi:hypothetical protein
MDYYSFSYVLCHINKRDLLLFLPYPEIKKSKKYLWGKPIYLEAKDYDEPYPFPKRVGLLDKIWWDLRYLQSNEKKIICPTIISRDFCAKVLGLRYCDNLLTRHLCKVERKTVIASFDPYVGFAKLQSNTQISTSIEKTKNELLISNANIGITGSLLIDPTLFKLGRDIDIVISSNQNEVENISQRILMNYLNKSYPNIWPLKAVINDSTEVDIFFVPPKSVFNLIKKIKMTGNLSEISFNDIVLDDSLSFYAPTIIEGQKYFYLIFGTAIRGEFRNGRRIEGCGFISDDKINSKSIILIEDPVVQLKNSPSLR